MRSIRLSLLSSINSQVANIMLPELMLSKQRRVHSNLEQRGDIVVVDGTSNIDLSDAKYFLFIILQEDFHLDGLSAVVSWSKY